MNGRCRASQVVDVVHLDIERKGHIVAQQLKVRMIEQMGDVVLGAGEEVVKTDDIMAVVQQAFAKVRAEEACTANDEDAGAVGVVFHRLPLRAENARNNRLIRPFDRKKGIQKRDS